LGASSTKQCQQVNVQFLPEATARGRLPCVYSCPSCSCKFDLPPGARTCLLGTACLRVRPGASWRRSLARPGASRRQSHAESASRLTAPIACRSRALGHFAPIACPHAAGSWRLSPARITCSNDTRHSRSGAPATCRQSHSRFARSVCTNRKTRVRAPRGAQSHADTEHVSGALDVRMSLGRHAVYVAPRGAVRRVRGHARRDRERASAAPHGAVAHAQARSTAA